MSTAGHRRRGRHTGSEPGVAVARHRRVRGALQTAVTHGLERAVARRRSLPDVSVPDGVMVELPGRGATSVIDLPGPTPAAPTVLLMHGIGTTAALTWFPLLRWLARDHRVVTFDHRWHGRGIVSENFTLADCADDAAAVLDVLDVGTAVVVGYSMGGATAQVFWRRHRMRTAGLVLCSTSARWPGNAAEWTFYRTLSALSPRLRARVEERVRERHGSHGAVEAASASLREWALAELRRTSPWILPIVLGELGRFDSRRWIGTVDVPTGIVITARDRAIRTERQRELAALVPQATVRDAPGGHTSLTFDLANWHPVFASVLAEVVRQAGPGSAGPQPESREVRPSPHRL